MNVILHSWLSDWYNSQINFKLFYMYILSSIDSLIRFNIYFNVQGLSICFNVDGKKKRGGGSNKHEDEISYVFVYVRKKEKHRYSVNTHPLMT